MKRSPALRDVTDMHEGEAELPRRIDSGCRHAGAQGRQITVRIELTTAGCNHHCERGGTSGGRSSCPPSNVVEPRSSSLGGVSTVLGPRDDPEVRAVRAPHPAGSHRSRIVVSRSGSGTEVYASRLWVRDIPVLDRARVVVVPLEAAVDLAWSGRRPRSSALPPILRRQRTRSSQRAPRRTRRERPTRPGQ